MEVDVEKHKEQSASLSYLSVIIPLIRTYWVCISNLNLRGFGFTVRDAIYGFYSS